MTGRRGSILIITLWILAILVILSIGIGGRMALELKLTAFNRDNTVALYLAKAGVERAMAVIQNESHTVDSLNESWSDNNEDQNPLFKEIEVGESGNFTVSHIDYDKRKVYGFRDEESRVNINCMPREVISRLITYLDPENRQAEDIAYNIEDWRDEGETRADGTPEYDDSEQGYRKKNNHLDAADELLLIKGMDKGLFDKIKDYITVYPVAGSAKINVNTAPAPVLFALGFEQGDIDEIIASRSAERGPEGYVPFTQSNFGNFLVKLPGDMQGLVAYGSCYFRVVSAGYSANGRARKTVTAVVSGNETLFWNEE